MLYKEVHERVPRRRGGLFIADAENAGSKSLTKRQRFLAEIGKVVPWSRLRSVIEPCYPMDERGRSTIGLERTLQIYLPRQWYGLSDEGLEDALFDATIVEAPPSTLNAEKSLDPEMDQTKRGNEWRVGTKTPVGVDADSGVVHSVVGTAANVSDVSQAHVLLRGHEEQAFGDAGYVEVGKRDEMKGEPVKWRVAATPDRQLTSKQEPDSTKLRNESPSFRAGATSA